MPKASKLSLFLLLFLFGCASRLDILIPSPPQEYIHSFPGVTQIKTETLKDIQKDCSASVDIHPGDYIYSCSVHIPGTSLICLQWYPSLDEVTLRMLNSLKLVEEANCNGWHDKGNY